jgi:RecB family exonuclease
MAYYKRYELGIRSENTDATRKGTLAHKILELYYDPCKLANPEECVRLACAEVSCPGKENFEHAIRMARWMMDWEPRHEDLGVIGCEVEFHLFRPGGQEGIGYMDRLDYVSPTVVQIDDYKSGFFIPSRDELAKKHQTLLYPAYIFSNLDFAGVEEVRFRYIYLNTGRVETISVFRKDAMEYLTYFDHLFDCIVKDDHPVETVNSFCWNCPHRAECKEYSKLFSIAAKAIPGLADIADKARGGDLRSMAIVYDALGVMESNVEKERKPVKGWVTAALFEGGHSKLVFDDVKLSLVQRKEKFCVREDIEGLIRKRGMEKDLLSWVPVNDLIKFVSGDGAAYAELEGMLTEMDGARYPLVTKVGTSAKKVKKTK